MNSTMEFGVGKHSSAISLTTTKSTVLCPTKEDVSGYLIAKSVGVQGGSDVVLVSDAEPPSLNAVAMPSEKIFEISLVH